MVLTFDTSRAPLRLADFVALVRAVVAARPADESIWLEWKSSLDLGSPDGKVHLARGIVGLANRMPNVAHPYCEGRGYLVIGAAPGETQGVREVDPAVLDAWLRPYLGVDGPRWQPHWLEMDGVTVLVVEVAAPHMGDPMHMIHKEGPKVRDGSVLVRRPGSTEPATSTELQALLARMSAAGRLEGVRFALAEPAVLMPIDFSQAAVEEWTEAQRQRCLRSLRAHLQAVREDAPQRQASGFRAPPVRVTMGHLKELVARRAAGERLTVEEERDLEAGSSALKGFSESIAGAFPSLLSPARETRSREEYEAQVKDYLAKCSRLLPAVLRSTAGERLPACVFEIANDTDRNFPAVQVEVYVPGDVEAVRARQRASNEGRLPRPPLAYGTRQAYWWAGLEFGDPLTRSPGLRASDLGVARPSAQPSGPAVSIENGGSARLRFSPVDIRPQHAVRLPPVVLLPQQPQDSTVVMAWSATSTGAPGVVRGELVLPVCGEVWSIREAAGISGD